LAPASEAARKDDWDRHWLQFGAANEHNPAQSYRRHLVANLLELDDRQSRVLDVGSGQGDFEVELLRRHPNLEMLGLEVSEAAVEIAKHKAPGASFEQRDLLGAGEPAPDQREWADYAICSEVLEHVDEPERLLANARAYMAPGCRLVVTVPGGPMSAFDRHIGHRRHFSPAALRSLLVESGFDVEAAYGAGFPFFNLYRLAVIARGERLVEQGASATASSAIARATMRTFNLLFRLNLPIRRWGWQTVAVARVPRQGPAGA
jgi:2-polyprenyl-3-methyl-5-hydroxy-6-metoxy-1,4-benzoquinol methylase